MAFQNGGLNMNLLDRVIMEKKLLDKWLQGLAVGNVSEHTLLAYRRDLEGFFEFCENKSLSLFDVEASDLREFIGHRVQYNNVKNSSISRQVTAIRQFMKWATLNKHIEHNTVEDVKVRSNSSYLPTVLDIDVINQILDQAPPADPINNQLWLRDKAIMELFYSSGMRLGELHKLVIGDLDFKQLLVRVVGKGNKERVIPFGRKARDAIFEWFAVYEAWIGEKPTRSMPLFASSRGGALSYIQIHQRVGLQAKRAGVDTSVHPHVFRHSFATHMLTESQDIRSVQEMLGHASMSTTQIYTHLDFNTLMNSYDKAHPRAISEK